MSGRTKFPNIQQNPEQMKKMKFNDIFTKGGWLRDDEALYTGKVNGQFVDEFPFPIGHDELVRGQQRFNIYCTPCHSRLGDGKGMVVQRGLRQAASFHQDRLRQEKNGYFFDVITNGFGAMPDYATQIPVRDRWLIVAYVRTLQLSQHARVEVRGILHALILGRPLLPLPAPWGLFHPPRSTTLKGHRVRSVPNTAVD